MVTRRYEDTLHLSSDVYSKLLLQCNFGFDLPARETIYETFLQYYWHLTKGIKRCKWAVYVPFILHVCINYCAALVTLGRTDTIHLLYNTLTTHNTQQSSLIFWSVLVLECVHDNFLWCNNQPVNNKNNDRLCILSNKQYFNRCISDLLLTFLFWNASDHDAPDHDAITWLINSVHFAF